MERDVRPLKVFVNSPLANIAAQRLNLEIKRLLVEEGFACILPQEIIPPGPNANSTDVFRVNLDLVKQCDIVLSVLDEPGEGVIFEMGVAFALGKPIIAFRSNKQSYLGKVIEGLWKELPNNRKAQNLDELRNRLKDFRVFESGSND